MTTSNAIDLHLVEQKTAWEIFCDNTSKLLENMLEKLKKTFESPESQSLEDIVKAFGDLRQNFMGQMLEHFIQAKCAGDLDLQIFTCPHCGAQLAKRQNSSRTLETLLGKTEISRPYFYCRKCKQGFTPFDQSLKLSQRSKQDDLQRLALEFAAEIPFERASELFEKSTKTSCSNHFMHDVVVSFGQAVTLEDVIPSEAEITRRIEKVAEGKKYRPIMVVCVDGAYTPIRQPGGRDEKRGKGEWKEAKGIRIYLPDGDDIVQIASWHQTCDIVQIAKDIELIASLIPQKKVRIALLGDGAHWLWKIMEKAFPGGRQILDYYHCSEHLHEFAQAHFANSEKAHQWVESALARLSFKDGPRHVIGGLGRMNPKDDKDEASIAGLKTYLQNNKKKVHYNGARIGGYPIGSGGIESANKFICHTRIKRSGAWWLQTNCNNMLKLRCSLVNGTFQKAFSTFAAQEKASRGENPVKNG